MTLTTSIAIPFVEALCFAIIKTFASTERRSEMKEISAAAYRETKKFSIQSSIVIFWQLKVIKCVNHNSKYLSE
jgi:hypothetical protein